MSSEGGKIPFPNRLWRARRRHGLGQKQVAFLIEKTLDEVSRYERGLHLPELPTLLALEIVYGMPLRLLFPELLEQVRDRISARIESRDALAKLLLTDAIADRIRKLAQGSALRVIDILKLTDLLQSVV